MSNQTNRPEYGFGLALLRQQYMADLSELMIRTGLTEIERLRLRKALVDGYLLQRAEERKAIASQLLDDHKLSLKR